MNANSYATEQKSMSKFCVDCRWYERGVLATVMSVPYSLRSCNSQTTARVDPVSGRLRFAHKFCEQERRWSDDENCGPEAKFFEQHKPIWLRVIETVAR